MKKQNLEETLPKEEVDDVPHCFYCGIVVDKIRCFNCNPEVIKKRVKPYCVICTKDLTDTEENMLDRYLTRGNWCGPCVPKTSSEKAFIKTKK
jgi:hypothetical protein